MAAVVRIYTSPTCPYCRKTKELLHEQGVDYENHEVTSDPEAMEEMLRVSGGVRKVPVIAVCDEVIIGFDRDRLLQAVSCLQQSTPV